MSYAPKRKTDGGSDRPTKFATRPRQPAFHNLREKYPTVERLEEHLKSLSRPAVEALILSGAFPEVIDKDPLSNFNFNFNSFLEKSKLTEFRPLRISAIAFTVIRPSTDWPTGAVAPSHTIEKNPTNSAMRMRRRNSCAAALEYAIR